MNDIPERNRQYKELSMSKNREPFRLFVRRKGETKYERILEGAPDYLCERGDEYKRLGMIEHYYVSKREYRPPLNLNDEREAIARIIDPFAWQGADDSINPYWWANRRNRALAKADDILALPALIAKADRVDALCQLVRELLPMTDAAFHAEASRVLTGQAMRDPVNKARRRAEALLTELGAARNALRTKEPF